MILHMLLILLTESEATIKDMQYFIKYSWCVDNGIKIPGKYFNTRRFGPLWGPPIISYGGFGAFGPLRGPLGPSHLDHAFDYALIEDFKCVKNILSLKTCLGDIHGT